MTGSTDSEADAEVGRTTPEHKDWTNAILEEPTASRQTLTRRLRAVERALGGADEIEAIEPVIERDPTTEDLDAVEERLLALERAVRAVGEHLTARDRVRRTGDGLESVRQAVEALSEFEFGTDSSHEGAALSETDPESGSTSGESPAEWLDRVAAGGVTPPPVE